MTRFVHLRCRSDCTLFGSTMPIRDICRRAKELGMPAVALTDRNTMRGTLEFYREARWAGIKPILGCEIRLGPARFSNNCGGYLQLLARDSTGYHNLIKLVTDAHTGRFRHALAMDWKKLPGHTDGLYALSGGLDGVFSEALRAGDFASAVQTACDLDALFPGSFFLELQDNGLSEQRKLNTMLIQLARQTGLPLVATNDCRCLDQKDMAALDALALADEISAEANSEATGHWFRTGSEMREIFSHSPEALSNAVMIAELCDVVPRLGMRTVPVPTPAGAYAADEELADLARHGLAVRLRDARMADASPYLGRLEHELQVITQAGYAEDFLLARDLVHWAKSQDVLVGPGWGAAPCSLLAWALGITDLDPLRHGLVLERFMNRARVFLPDISVCLSANRRQDVLKYLVAQYGHDHVAQVAHFSTIGPLRAIRLAGRYLGMDAETLEQIAAHVPEESGDILAELRSRDVLQSLMTLDSQVERLLAIAQTIARLLDVPELDDCAIAISRPSLPDTVPLERVGGGLVATQYDRRNTELAGLGLLHVAGLRALSVLEATAAALRTRGLNPPHPFALPPDDSGAYAILARGELEDICWQDPHWPWQDASTSMADCMRRLRPTCMEHIAAMLSLYRPGPLLEGLLDDYLAKRHGGPSCPHPCLESILYPTHGVMIYHDQMLLATQAIAGYSLEDADLLRRAMGKQQADEMRTQWLRFQKGAAGNGIKAGEAATLFECLRRTAELGVAKGHFLGLAHICYATAYFKAHFPREYLAASRAEKATA
jgi:DNA polymerase-3 subunit alpha